MKNLINYCLSFYGPSANLYEENFKNEDGTFGCSKEEIIKAMQKINKIKDHKWSGGSEDREIIRDVMLFQRGWDLLKLEYGQYIEREILGNTLTRARIKEYWVEHYNSFEIELTDEDKERWEKRLDQLEIFDK